MPNKASKYSPFKRGAIEKISFIVLLTFLFSAQGSIIAIDSAYAAKVGQSCTKAGLKSGSLVCTKVKNKLIWLLVKKKQSISASYPAKIDLSSQELLIDYAATSGLLVQGNSLVPKICTLQEHKISLLAAGYCIIRFTQLGNTQYLSASSLEIKFLILGNNEIDFRPPTSMLLSSSSYSILASSTSGLPVSFESSTPDFCSVSKSTITLIKVGWCTIIASQDGSDFYSPAQRVEAVIAIQGKNQISFTPSTSLLLSIKTYRLTGASTSGLPIVYASTTPDICSVFEATLTLLNTGSCTIVASQSGSELYVEAQSVQASILISNTRVISDQPDSVNGFQVKIIYVIPSDGIDHSYDTNGYIAAILEEGNKFLRSQIGLQVPIDKNITGYDIQFLKSRQPTSYFLSAKNLDDELLAESLLLENPGSNRKSYIFFIDVEILANGEACGYTSIGGMTAVIAIGSECTRESHNLKNYAAHTWPHELMHNFGVQHTPDDPCDFMRGEKTVGTCPWSTPWTLDKERTRYVGSSAQGQDILKLPVWEGYTAKDYWAKCLLNPVPRGDGFKYAYCPTGTQTIGALSYCWKSLSSISLEEFVDGAWKSLGAGNHYSEPWGQYVKWTCNDPGYTAPWKQLTVTNPGISLYRWMVNGRESEQFKVIWVR